MSETAKKTVILASFFVGVLIIAVIAYLTVGRFTPSDPLAGSDQLVLVLSRTHASTDAVLQVFNRENGAWKFIFSCPAVIGRSGMGWGRGLHNDRDRMEGDPVKEEGDGRTPEGAFALIGAYGYQPPSMVNIDFPYTQVTESWICCDDAGSRRYNEVFDYRDGGLNPENLPSHEKMLRDDEVYKYTVFVGHNVWKPKPGAGSCIFIHLWSGPGSNTAGCTAISEESMLTLLSELHTGKNPVMVALVRRNYMRLKEIWGLPDVTI